MIKHRCPNCGKIYFVVSTDVAGSHWLCSCGREYTLRDNVIDIEKIPEKEVEKNIPLDPYHYFIGQALVGLLNIKGYKDWGLESQIEYIAQKSIRIADEIMSQLDKKLDRIAIL